MNPLLIVSAVCGACSLGYYAIATAIMLRYARRVHSAAPPLPKIPPRLAILKPLHGRGRHLADNIVSMLEATYPRAEFIFGVDSYEDDAAQVPVAIRARYQYAAITMVVGAEPACSNRKIAKVIRMVERAPNAQVYVMSDADVSVDADYLRRLGAEIAADEKIGIVTCAYRGNPDEALGSRLEAAYVNTDIMPQLLVSNAFEPMRHAMGATIAIRREALESIGGFAAVKDMIADDYMIGKLAAEHGWRVVLSSALVTLNCEETTFRDFWNHQLRWARTYRTARPISLATLAIHGPFWALMIVATGGIAVSTIAAAIALIGARVAMAATIYTRVVKLPRMTRDLWLVPFKDLVITAIWFASLLSNRVTWAGRRLEILKNGKMKEVAD